MISPHLPIPTSVLSLSLLCAALISACGDKQDDDDGGGGDGGGATADDSGDGGDGGDGGGGGFTVEACDMPELDLCVEFWDYEGMEAWCAQRADAEGIQTEFLTEECGKPNVGDCNVSEPSGIYPEGPSPLVVSFYSPTYDDTTGRAACDALDGYYY